MDNKDNKKRNIVIAIMVVMFLGAVEGTVVTTAIPTISKSLKGFELISWVFSIYMLAAAVATPIYGKLADLYGRKNILSIGVIIFLVGSSLCGISQNMYELIGFRALQGLGAGSIFTVSFTIIGDVFPPSERARIQGWLSSVWGVASLIGPFVGGFIIDSLSWHWIFFINIPFGILSIILLQTNLKENLQKKRHKIDFAGTFVLSLALISILLGMMVGGKSGRLFSQLPLTLIGASAVFIILFYFVEKKAAEPIFPFEIFKRTIRITNTISFIVGAILIGTDVYLPIYIQNVLGYGATISGLSMAPMSISWILTSSILAKAIPRFGERVVTGVGALILLVSSGLLYLLGVNSSIIEVMVIIFIAGFGFGSLFTTLLIVVQSAVDYDKRGAATASNTLLSSVGQTIGVSLFGYLLNTGIIQFFANTGVVGVNPDKLYIRQSAKSALTQEQIHAAINGGLHGVFIMFMILALICCGLTMLFSNELKEKRALKE